MKKNFPVRALTCFSVLFLIGTASRRAEAGPLVRKSFFDPTAGPNQYVVNFPPELGGSTIFMPIVGGSFELQTDGGAGTAKLLSWSQDIDPIEIFGKSTGPIKVTLDPTAPSDGTFDPVVQQFHVSATFFITFDDSQLREFGFVSPLPLKGTENGNIYGVGSIGTVHMFLEGSGSVGPGSFNYTCQTSARFEYSLADDEAQPGDVNHDRSIDISDPVQILGDLFLGETMICPNAAEVNSDGKVNLADAVYLFDYLFLGGPSTPLEPVKCTAGSGGG